MPTDKKSQLLKRYRNAESALLRFKSEQFYPGTKVVVDCPRYKGEGAAVTDNQCPVDQVAVLLPNGNVWRYSMESVQPSA